jgi:signal transduction histidine kinase
MLFQNSFSIVINACDVVITLPRIPLELALRNLIGNAIKHHDKEHGIITIDYALEQNKHIISVSDDGPGIDPGLQEKATEMFQTLKSRDEIEGSGLGLSVVKKSVERFNGSMKIMSDGAHGTTVELGWPIITKESL